MPATMATATKASKGFKVICPHCHDTDATVSLDLADVRKLSCSSCDETFSPEEARDLVAAELARWDAVCRWVELATEMASE